MKELRWQQDEERTPSRMMACNGGSGRGRKIKGDL